MVPTLKNILEAEERIRPHVHRTPVFTSGSINALTGGDLFFKCENLQRVGAFKYRGASNAVLSLEDDEAKAGVATHSSGNHAQALALAAKTRGIAAHIVMPDNSPRVKVDGVRGYGGIITFCEPTLAARESTLEEIVEKTGASFIHPYNDYRIIAGQATCAKEFLEDRETLDILVAPVGGGGLISGAALAARYLSPETGVIAAEPEGADDAFRSFCAGTLFPSEKPKTVADGLLTSLGDLTFPIIRDHVSAILTVSEENIIRAMRFIWERMKLVVEPSGAVPLGAVLQHGDVFKGKKTGIIISGGNVDLDMLPWNKK